MKKESSNQRGKVLIYVLLALVAVVLTIFVVTRIYSARQKKIQTINGPDYMHMPDTVGMNSLHDSRSLSSTTTGCVQSFGSLLAATEKQSSRAMQEQHHREEEAQFKREIVRLIDSRISATQDYARKNSAEKGVEKKNDRYQVSQVEVDALVKQEVRRQLTGLKKKKDPRVARLQKVVALEKMKRLAKEIAEDADTEENVDF